MTGTPKKYRGLLGPKIMVVELWRDYNFLCQTHEAILTVENVFVIYVMSMLIIDSL
jgi:hypothetical protein